jgi:CRISPR-associated endonuclease Cas1
MGRAYYLFRSGRLRRRQNTLYLEWEADGHAQRQAIPVEDVEALFAMGELDLNTRLLSFLGRHGVSLHVFNYYGFYVGSFYPRETRAAGQVVVAQALHSADPSRRLALARGFVEGALFHMRVCPKIVGEFKRPGRFPSRPGSILLLLPFRRSGGLRWPPILGLSSAVPGPYIAN